MNWKEEVRTNITKASGLREYMNLTDSQIEHLDKILSQFPMTVTRYYLSLIDWDNPFCDPVFRMCIPSIEETDLSGDFDTSGEADNTVISGLQHKYGQTALILSTHRCAMYCRHCFLNSNQVIKRYLEQFSSIPHLDLIRFGTRIPVVLPMRIYDDPELLALLKTYTQKKQIYVVTQFNHPNELTDEARKAVKALLDSGIVVKNQTVLLKGVNDSIKTLESLLKDLTQSGVIPYYIFQCRPVSGVKNQFQLPLKQGYEIVEGAKHLQNGQGKCIRYAMSHVSGKIEILGPLPDGRMLFKYHQAKYDRDKGRIFAKDLAPDQAWLDGDI